MPKRNSNPVSSVSVEAETPVQVTAEVVTFLMALGAFYTVLQSKVAAYVAGVKLPDPAKVRHYISWPTTSAVKNVGRPAEPVVCEAFLPSTIRKKFHADAGDGVFVSIVSPALRTWQSIGAALFYNIARFGAPGEMGVDWSKNDDTYKEIKGSLGLLGDERNIKVSGTRAELIAKYIADFESAMGKLPPIPTIDAFRDPADAAKSAKNKMLSLLAQDAAIAALPGIGAIRGSAAVAPYLDPNHDGGFLAFVRRDAAGLVTIVSTFALKFETSKVKVEPEGAEAA